MDPFASTPEQRHYHCGLIDVNGRHPCTKKFVRPEHLRRHVRTVHGREQPYTCQVPDCDKAFSRGDNLREHYWTHLSRGGRTGKNKKMDFLELKAILGPKQRKLARRLRMKLNKQKEKQMKSKIWVHLLRAVVVILFGLAIDTMGNLYIELDRTCMEDTDIGQKSEATNYHTHFTS
jgi:hypothetical protein